MARLQDVPITRVRRDPSQPRQEFHQRSLEELAESMRHEGLLQPITVRPDGDGGYVIVSGERRWRAAMMLGWQEVPALVMDGADDRKVKRLQLLENVVRKDLNPVEVARAYRAMMDQGMSPAEIARAVGKPAGDVTWLVGILQCRQEVLDMVQRGQVTPTVAWHIARLSPDSQLKALQRMASGEMKAQDALLLCDRMWARENQAEAFRVEVEHKRRAERLSRSALDRICRAAADLWVHEQRHPGSLDRAVEREPEAARLAARELRRMAEELERRL